MNSLPKIDSNQCWHCQGGAGQVQQQRDHSSTGGAGQEPGHLHHPDRCVHLLLLLLFPMRILSQVEWTPTMPSSSSFFSSTLASLPLLSQSRWLEERWPKPPLSYILTFPLHLPGCHPLLPLLKGRPKVLPPLPHLKQADRKYAQEVDR